MLVYLDDYCEEIECEEVEHDEQQMTEPCATPKRRGGKGKGRAKDKQGGPRAKKRRFVVMMPAWDQLGLPLLALVVLLLFLVHRDRFSFFFPAPFH